MYTWSQSIGVDSYPAVEGLAARANHLLALGSSATPTNPSESKAQLRLTYWCSVNELNPIAAQQPSQSFVRPRTARLSRSIWKPQLRCGKRADVGILKRLAFA